MSAHVNKTYWPRARSTPLLVAAAQSEVKELLIFGKKKVVVIFQEFLISKNIDFF